MTISSCKNENVSERKFDCGRVADPNDPVIEARYKLNDLFTRAWMSYAVSALSSHKVFDLIEDEPVSAEYIADKTHLHAGTLYRALRALAANEILQQDDHGNFYATPVSTLLRSDHPYSWSGMAMMWNHPVSLRSWEKFGEVLTDGRSGIEHAFGKKLYEYFHDKPELTQAFADAMTSNSAHPAISIAQAFPFEKYSSVLDLGGGNGLLLAAVLKQHENLTGAVFEIDDLVVPARQYLAESGLADRAKVICGNFLTSIPPGFDVYMVKNSLWNWPDDDCLAVLKNVRQAMKGNNAARFIIIEYIISPETAPRTTAYDLQILNLPGGRARTQIEYQTLLNSAGLELQEIIRAQDQQLLVAASI